MCSLFLEVVPVIGKDNKSRESGDCVVVDDVGRVEVTDSETVDSDENKARGTRGQFESVSNRNIRLYVSIFSNSIKTGAI
jgi:hypothetical protein